MTCAKTPEGLNGRLHVCDDCDWIGDGEDAHLVAEGDGPFFRCPDCNARTHLEYFGNPLPEEGTTWKTPNGLDRCPVCATSGIFVHDEPGACLCGAEFGGLSTTELITVPDRGEQDVIIRASEDDLEHKVFDYTDGTDLGDNPRRSLAYWSIPGTPQQTGPGRTIMFSTDGEHVDYYAPISTVEEGKIWFAFLSPVAMDAPTAPPTRGIKYVNWGDYPW